MGNYILPALRGHFGSWIYYSSLMPIKFVAKHVSYIKDVHQSKTLSDAIQREIKMHRPALIKDYLLNENDKFFNSLVLAVYNGTPEWFPAGIDPETHVLNMSEVPTDCNNNIGFLRFSGNEEIITIDGQHRLAGIKAAVKENHDLDDCVSVIFVAHDPHVDTKRIKTRRLFTALNKHAKPVDLFEIIMLDENDLTAIVTRKMYETHPWFSGDRIAIHKGSKITNTSTALTTIEYLYAMLSDLFVKVYYKHLPSNISSLSFREIAIELRNGRRLSEKIIDKFYSIAISHFELLAKYFSELNEYFTSSKFGDFAQQIRETDGGCILFRTVGLKLFNNLLIELPGTLEDRLRILASLPRYFNQKPYNGILWDIKHRIVESNEAPMRNLLLHCLGQELHGSRMKSALNGWRLLNNGQLMDDNTLPATLGGIVI